MPETGRLGMGPVFLLLLPQGSKAGKGSKSQLSFQAPLTTGGEPRSRGPGLVLGTSICRKMPTLLLGTECTPCLLPFLCRAFPQCSVAFSRVDGQGHVEDLSDCQVPRRCWGGGVSFRLVLVGLVFFQNWFLGLSKVQSTLDSSISDVRDTQP